MATMVAGDLDVGLDERGLIVSCPQCEKRNRLTYERLGQTFRCGGCHTELEVPREPIEASSQTAFQSLIQRCSLPLLVDFWAPWCGPCKMVAPELAKVAAQSNGQFLVVKVNTEELPIAAQQYRINAIPTLALFRQGRELARKSGALPASAILQFLSHFGG
jgi:thioredoxin 2